jgi:hypothetical protein
MKNMPGTFEAQAAVRNISFASGTREDEAHSKAGGFALSFFGREEFVLALLKFFDGAHIVIGSADIQPVAFIRFHCD